MKHLCRLLKLQAIALLSLVIVAAAIGGYGALESISFKSALIGPWDSATLLFGYALIFGLVPALLFGAPLYFALSYWVTPSWHLALLVGVVPGFVALAIEPSIAPWALGGGAAVALLTHMGAKRLAPRPTA